MSERQVSGRHRASAQTPAAGTEPLERLSGGPVARRPAAEPRRRRRLERTPGTVFAAAFVFLLGALAATYFAQFRSSDLAAWCAIGLSILAIATTIAALRRPRQAGPAG